MPTKFTNTQCFRDFKQNGIKIYSMATSCTVLKHIIKRHMETKSNKIEILTLTVCLPLCGAEIHYTVKHSVS